MEKRMLILGLVILALVLIFALVGYLTIKSFVIGGPEPKVLAEKAIGVETSIGTVDLPVGTRLGGEPEKFIILEETREFVTTVGIEIIVSGTMIDCEHEPGEPDPCEIT